MNILFFKLSSRSQTKYCVTHICAAILISLTLASVALAAEYRSVSVVCRGALPFDQKKLLAAINLRLPLMRIDLRGNLPVVEVRVVAQDRASITVGSSRRVISLRGLSGMDAARIAALLSLDLISNQQKTVARRPSPGQGTSASDFLFVGISPRISLGVSQWDPSFEPTVDLNMKISRNFLVFVECGFTWTVAGEDQRELTLMEIPLRAGVAFRYRWFEARAGVVLRPYFFSKGSEVGSAPGDDQGVLVGGGLGLFFRRVLSRRLTGYAAVGLDLFSNPKEFRVGGKTALTTSWAVPWMGIGAGWQGG